MYDILKQNFIKPSSEFTCMPFWFINDEIDEKELISQIDKFHSKGVDGFIYHPRIGFPMSVPYMSEKYLDYVELCVKHAAELKMSVALYDEGAYPSGSAHGLVVKSNPIYAARCLYRVKSDDYIELDEGETVVAEIGGYIYIEGFTGGTIRGIYQNEDDGQPNAPKAADLLNPNAVAEFIKLTHEAYFTRLRKYFGDTVIGIFTDEPSLTGRNANMSEKITWTGGFLDDFFDEGGSLDTLCDLFDNTSTDTFKIYNKAIRKRLSNSFYKQLSDWCKAHYISLMGHPELSGETDMLQYFQIPGQDLVWRLISPENNLDSKDSVVAKCSADTARHINAHRNSDEVLGVCGKNGNSWDFTASDMMWYFNFMFARGVNMIIQHAFYYSLRTKLQSNERPPDVGIHNVWWRYYERYSEYIKRMCWLNTNSANKPYAAVLCSKNNMPYLSVKELYENSIDFNYLNTSLMVEMFILENGKMKIGRYSYDIILIDDSVELDNEAKLVIDLFEKRGGKVCRSGSFAEFVKFNSHFTERFTSDSKDIRLTRLNKSGIPFILLTNEGNTSVIGTLELEIYGKCERYNPFTGEIYDIPVMVKDDIVSMKLEIMPRIPTIIAINTDDVPLLGINKIWTVVSEIDFNSSYANIDKKQDERYYLTFDEVCDQCRVYINDQPAGEMLFIPWELDITDSIGNGMNYFSFEIDESKANDYGIPVKTGIFGGKIVTKKETQIS